jgi:hypothetical protein
MNIKTEYFYESCEKCQACSLGKGTQRLIERGVEAQVLKVEVCRICLIKVENVLRERISLINQNYCMIVY